MSFLYRPHPPHALLAATTSSRALSRTVIPAAKRTLATTRDEIRNNGDEAEEINLKFADITYQRWMTEYGRQFRHPTPGKPNWLGGDHPFPMNPHFKPPPPTSDSLRQAIFDAHVRNPELNSVRELSQRFGLSLKRVEAIIRLKGLEVKWKMENRPLRLNFQREMEACLGVKQFTPKSATSLIDTTSDAHLADAAADQAAPTTSAGKRGIDKIFWEGVEDGQQAIVIPHLQALADARAERKAASEAASAQFAASHSHVVEPAVEGRKPIVFIDVGNKFMNQKDETRRQKAAAARRRLKEKKALSGKHAA
ncbi:hypothetical protein FRB99_003466 [Tulasnella sp. 403]|nr:hypothetical protein FRB99_003466 [Tulasnella sp. 403]